MKRIRTMATAAGAAFALTLAAGASAAFAAEEQPDISGYSYLEGQSRAASRNAIYAQAEAIEDEAEREAFLKENGIAETAYSEEAAASYSYVSGRERGAGYRR